jgi:hypothetical protein
MIWMFRMPARGQFSGFSLLKAACQDTEKFHTLEKLLTGLIRMSEHLKSKVQFL